MAKKVNSKVLDTTIEEKEQETVTKVENKNDGTEIVQGEEKKKENVEITENENIEESTKTKEKDTYISVRKKPWVDLQDNKYEYKQGDVYPREGLEVSEERIKELSGINNKLGEVLIQKVENKE